MSSLSSEGERRHDDTTCMSGCRGHVCSCLCVRERGGGGGAVEFMHCCWSERTLAKRHPTEVHRERERERETERARAPSKCA